jgi:acetone carboxylase gamma subunit
MSFKVNEYVTIEHSSGQLVVKCAKCGQKLCSGNQQWKDHVPRIESPLSKAGPRRSSSGKFVLREYVCPRCAVVLDVEVTQPEDPPLYDNVKVETLTTLPSK